LRATLDFSDEPNIRSSNSAQYAKATIEVVTEGGTSSLATALICADFSTRKLCGGRLVPARHLRCLSSLV
jgi:hypothetical protein